MRLLCATNVGKAEKLKSGRINAQRRLSPIFGFNTKLTAKQETILLRSSRILGSVYPTVRTQEQLQDPHSARSRDDIVALPGNCYFKSFKEWQQNATVSEVDTEAAVFCAQSRLNDCSVVASICVAANWNMNFHESVLSRILADCSSNAEILFNVALHVNGTWRKIQVDDIMPFEEDTDKPLFVHCPRKLELMMPAILEKAYLTMFGTSASKGSNSASDLYYFTQWIPEFQTLRLPSWETRQLWKKILTAHGDGQVLLTTGTPRLSNDPDNVYKLIPNHNYAVIKLIENDNYRGLLLRNPWFQGIDTISTFEGLTDHLSQFQISEMDSSMFWLDWDMACNLFDMLYMNWNPGQFAYMSSLHFEYPNIFPLRPEECSQIGSLPQYLVRNDSDTTVRLWLLLEVHISECNPSESQISLLFSKSQSRIYHCLDKFDVSTTVLQSRFALLKTSLDAQSAGILIASLGSEAPSVRCSLTFYADFPVTVNAAPQTLPELLMEESRFRPLNYTFDNRRVVSIPQHTPVWKFSSTKPYRTVLSLQCDHPDIPIGIMVIIGDAQGKFTNVFSVDKVFQSTQRYLPRYNALHIDRTPLINLYICACVYGDVKIDMNFTLNVACEEKFSLTYIPPAIHVRQHDYALPDNHRDISKLMSLAIGLLNVFINSGHLD